MSIVFKFYETKPLRRNGLTLFSSQKVETLSSDFISINISTLFCTITKAKYTFLCTVLKNDRITKQQLRYIQKIKNCKKSE